jgi:hypothetical protein
MADDWLGSGADHVMFHHSDKNLHERFLAHLYHSASTSFMKSDGGPNRTMAARGSRPGAQRHGLVMLHKESFGLLQSTKTNAVYDVVNREHRCLETTKSESKRLLLEGQHSWGTIAIHVCRSEHTKN